MSNMALAKLGSASLLPILWLLISDFEDGFLRLGLPGLLHSWVKPGTPALARVHLPYASVSQL